MTKAKARKRAKARAAAKAASPAAAKGGKPEDERRAGRFDPKSDTMRNTSGAHIRSPTAMKRGAARSR